MKQNEGVPHPDRLPPGEGTKTLVLTVFLSALVAVAEILGHEPPAAKPAAAPASEFSAARAEQILSRVLGDGAPHPVGSEADARVRQRIIGELERLGYEPVVETSFACGHSGSCAKVENVIARLPGRRGSKAVLLSAHYDSVGAGPGASDDGMGVAALLEIARILKTEPAHANPVLFLFDEGEEPGLIGAEGFIQQLPPDRPIGAVVNLENRGTSGTSYLFETSPGNRWLVDLAARVLRRPATSSLFYTVYKFLPNDTDLTVFKAHGLAGVNFAAIEGVTRYHTPRDDLAHASLSTLQHHGDNALAMARAFADRDARRPVGGDVVFFDLFGRGILRWPESAALPLAVATFALLLLVVAIWSRRKRVGLGSVLLGLAASAIMPVLAGAAGFGASLLLRRIGAVPTQWIAHPFWMLAAVWCLALVCTWLLAQWLASRAGSAGLWPGVWILWAVGAILLSWQVAGLSFLFFVPTAFAALFALGVVGLPGSSRLRWLAVALPAAAAAFFWLPVAFFLDTAVGSPFGEASTGLAVGLWGATAAPAFVASSSNARSRILATLLLGALIALAAAGVAPPFTADSPERMSIAFSEDADSKRSRWLAFPESGRLPRGLARQAPFAPSTIVPDPWSRRSRAFEARVTDLELPPLLVSVREDSTVGSARRVRLHIASQRRAPAVFLAISPSTPIRAIEVQGVPVPPICPRVLAWRGGWRVVSCLTTPAEGVDFYLETAPGSSLEVFVGDRSLGLPPAGDPLLRARGPLAAPSGEGDTTTVTRRLKL